jgi:hypothetical protein
MISYAPPICEIKDVPAPPHPFTFQEVFENVKQFFTGGVQPIARGPNDPLHSVLLQEHKHSIRPTIEGIKALNIEHGKTAQDLVPKASNAIQQEVQKAIDNHWNILSVEEMTCGGNDKLPFYSSNSGSILQPHLKSTAPLSGEEFAARLKQSAKMVPVLDKLLHVAFYYGLVEFFFIRPNLDLYKEEVEDDPMGVATESVSVAVVRTGILFVLAVITLVFS